MTHPRTEGRIPEALAGPHETTLRVRYQDTDAMGVVYHANYLAYFEVGRTEWLRARGLSYRELEAAGHGLAVIEASARYLKPARYDDVLVIVTTLDRIGRAQVGFAYEIRRGDERLATGATRLASIGPDGRPRALPEALRALARETGEGRGRQVPARPGSGQV